MKKLFKIYIFVIIMVLSFSLVTNASINEMNSEWVIVDQSDKEVNFKQRFDEWSKVENEKAYQGTERVTNRSYVSAEFKFTGTAFRWIGSVGPNRGEAEIYHNGELLTEVSLNQDTIEYQKLIYEEKLEPGTHTIKIIPKKNNYISIDAFGYIPTLRYNINRAKKMLYESSGFPNEIGDKIVSFIPEENRESLIDEIANGLFIEEKEPEEEKIKAEIGNLNQAIKKYENSKIDPVVPDLTGNGFDGSINSATLASGKINKAFEFDGEGEYVAIPDDFELFDGEHNFTIETWFKANDLPEEIQNEINEGLFSFFGERTLMFTFADGTDDPQKLGVRGNFEDSGWTSPVVTPVIDINEWYHLAVTYDPDTGWILYLDGEEVDSSSLTEAPAKESNESSIGAIMTGENRFFAGKMDEVRFWTTTRTEEEINENMDDELTGDEEELYAYWSFNEISKK